MATQTMGTSATNTLTALKYLRGIGSMNNTDLATINNAILDDLNVAHPRVRGAFDSQGLLIIPNRGVLKVLPGDLVGVDDEGWPVLVSAYSIANGNWTLV